MNSKDLLRQNRKYKRFLRQRQLLKGFKRYEKIKFSKQFTINIDGIKQNLIAYKKKDKVIVADAYTFKTLSITKRYTLNTVQQGLLAKRKVIKEIDGKISERFIQKLRLREIQRTPLKNVYISERNRASTKNVGRLFLNITFIGYKSGERHTVEGGSRSERLLNVPSQRQIAFDEAFKGALSQIYFTYEKYIINWVHYAYYEKLTRVVIL